ncbi:MAG: hypothetical protein WAW17_31180, partial [Rhodococcus sp. (in: high G+C Gram-positive bacteria)]|uniref:hypothetical protein n=1 Tax=Rhodococcus sp. TaxID=1831 RepID=UPI003BAEE5E3
RDRGIAQAVREIDEMRAENTKLLGIVDRYRQERDEARADAEKKRIEIAVALGCAELIPGHGWYAAGHAELVERAESLVSIELEHIECPVWCDECERMERWQSCPSCKGSGCGPGTASGAYQECELCAGDGREHDPDSAINGGA